MSGSRLPGLLADWQRHQREPLSAPVALVALVLSNLVPLVGVVFFGWEVQWVLVVYWIESAVVGVLNIFKIALAEGQPGGRVRRTRDGRPLPQTKGRLIPFFVLHYGGFWLGHGLFVLLFFPAIVSGQSGGVFLPDVSGLPVAGMVLAAIGLAISHLASFWLNFLGRREYLTISPDAQMLAPYGRVFVLHLTIVFGGIAVATLGSPLALVLLLVGLKTALDLGFHLLEHGRAASRAEVQP